MRKLTYSFILLFSFIVSMDAQYFSAVYPGAGNGLTASNTGRGYLVTTTKGVLKIDEQGQPDWNRQLTGIFLTDATSIQNSTLALTGFKGDDAYFNILDTNGVLQQSSVYAMTSILGQQDVGYAIRQVGGYYCMVGNYRKPGVAWPEAFFLCLNSSHNIAWAYKMEGPKSETFTSFQPVTNGGGFILLANTDSDGAGATDVFLLRTANDGSRQGYSLFGGPGEDKGWAVRPLSGGGFAVAGETNSFGNQQQGFLARLDGNGQLQWARAFNGAATLTDVIELADGSLLALGNKGTTAAPDDIVLLKTNASGQLQWARAYGNNNTAERAGSLSLLPDGGFLITGGAGAPAYNDLFLARTDANGYAGNCTGNSMPLTVSSITFQTPQPSGQLTYNLITGGQANRWSVVTNFSSPSLTPNLCVPVGTKAIRAIDGVEMNIFPNPSATPPAWAIECRDGQQLEARLTDACGRAILQEKLLLSAGYNEWRPALSTLPKGIYIASISNGQAVITKRFVIQ